MGVDPIKQRGGVVPISKPFSTLPSLTLLKDNIHQQIQETWGQYGYVTLRHKLYDCSDHEGFARKADIVALFRNDLGLPVERGTDEELDVYLGQLVTMRKTELRITSLMSSLRPALPQNTKLRVAEIFAALGPVDGAVRLGAWLEKLQNDELRAVVANAFGSEDEGSVADVPLTETTLLELLSDLSP